MKNKNIFKRIWNDSVLSSLISSGLWTLIIFIAGFVSSKITIIGNFLKNEIPVYFLLIEFIILLFIILTLFFIAKRKNETIAIKNNDISNDKNIINNLEKTIQELKRQPDNPRLELFKKGDIVIIKNSDAFLTTVEYTVVGKEGNSLRLIDNKGTEKKISPDALLTSSEYEAEKRKQKQDWYNAWGNKRKNNFFI